MKINTSYKQPIISNFYTKTRALINKEKLVQIILHSSKARNLEEKLQKAGLIVTDQNKPSKEDLELLDHWKERNWELASFYYIWSRTGHLADNGMDYQNKQADIVKSYIAKNKISEEYKPKALESILLDRKSPLPQESIGQIMEEREAVRATPIRKVPIEVLSSILWYGLNNVRHYKTKHNDIEANPLNAVQSFGSAFDVYVCVYNSEELKPGIYFYDIINNRLELTNSIDTKELRQKMYRAQVEQKAALTSSIAIILVCNFTRYQWRYRQESALRQLYVNCGQIMHPMMLLATSYKYKTHISPAIMDSVALEIIKLPKEEYQPMYILSVG